jgi:PAS domain S-box-containing protein
MLLKALKYTALGIILAVLGVALGRAAPPGALQFHPNPYAIIPTLVFCAIIFLLLLLNRPRNKTSEALWFSYYLLCGLFWAGGELLAHLAVTPGGAIFWLHLELVGQTAVPAAFFLFALAYTHRDSPMRQMSLWLTILLGSLTVITLGQLTNVLFDWSPAHSLTTPWGYVQPSGPGFGLLLLWNELGFVGALLMLIARYRQPEAADERRQIKVFIFAVLTPLVGGSITDGVLPIFGIHLPPASYLMPILATIMTVGILRYGLFRLNPRTFAPSLLQAMSEAVIVTDPHFRIEFVNAGALALLQVRADQLLGAQLTTLFSAPQFKLVQSQVIAPLSHRNIARLPDTLIRYADNTALPVAVSASRVDDLEGRIGGYSLVFTDLRDIKAAERQLQREKASVERKVVERTRELSEARAELEASIRSLPFGFALVNPANQVVFHNQLLETLFNRPIPDDLTSSHQLLQAVDADYRSALGLLDCLDTSRTRRQAIEKNVQIGTRYYRFFFTPILSPENPTKALGAVLIMEDTTEVKAQERSRDEFFSIASHELRTPLTAIRGNSQMLLDYYAEQFKDPDTHQMITDVHDASIRLITIVNDFLDVSRLEQGKLEFKTSAFEVPSLVQNLFRELDVTGSRRKLAFNLEPADSHAQVLADPDRTRQILVNLLGNAIKYTERGSVTVKLTPAGSMLKIAIVDTGQGIPEASQHLLFRKFQQASSSILTRDDTRSTGLGLYISRLIAEGMGGKVYLEKTQPGQGSTFVIELPLPTAPAIPPAQPPAAKPASKNAPTPAAN